jgi:hypothetical protein
MGRETVEKEEPRQLVHGKILGEETPVAQSVYDYTTAKIWQALLSPPN